MDRSEEREQDRTPRGDEVPQDGLGRDMAYGERQDDRYQGGSTGRSTHGRAGDDLLGIDADVPRGTDETMRENAPADTSAAGGARDGLDLDERDDVRRRDPSTH